jgi:excisionase family DNA binding protein
MRTEIRKLLNEEVMNVDQAALFLGVSRKTVWLWATDGTVPSFRTGHTFLIDRKDLEDRKANWRRSDRPPHRWEKVQRSGG